MILNSKQRWRAGAITLLLLFLLAAFVQSTWKQAAPAPDASVPTQVVTSPDLRVPDNRSPNSNAQSADSESSPLSASATMESGGVSQKSVFRLVLEEGECRLEAIEEVTGQFRPKRKEEAPHAGMIACRLIDSEGRLLAEERVHAPDHVCAVLDPNMGGSEPEVALLAGAGPQVFQVRFPGGLPAEKLEVHRISRTVPDLTTQLLASFAVPR